MILPTQDKEALGQTASLCYQSCIDAGHKPREEKDYLPLADEILTALENSVITRACQHTSRKPLIQGMECIDHKRICAHRGNCMPTIGDIKTAIELGYKARGHKYIWTPCTECGNERWVYLYRGKPQSLICSACDHLKPPWNKGVANWMTPEHLEIVRLTALNKRHTDESREKISLSKIGKPRPESVKQKLSIWRKNYYREHPEIAQMLVLKMHTPEAIAKGIESRKGYVVPEHIKKLMSIRMTGKNNPFYAQHHSEESKVVMRQIKVGGTLSDEHRRKIGESSKRNGISPETRAKMIISQKANRKRGIQMIGEGNPNWQGGISFEPYTHTFNEELKERVRSLDNYTCQLCAISQNGRKHDIHHIDYNKMNSTINNLITLCFLCHSKTFHNRDYWKKELQILIREKRSVL